MKFLYCSILALLISVQSRSQKGTLITAYIIHNEIYLTADSRGLFYGSKDSDGPLGYSDSVRKIFKLKQFYIGTVGNIEFGREFLNNAIDEFNKHPFWIPALETQSDHFGNTLI